MPKESATPTPCARGCRWPSRFASADRGRGRSQELLHDDRIDPLAVEPTLLAVDPYGAIPKSLVERHAAHVELERRQHELVKSLQAPEVVELLEQHAAGPLAAPRPLDVDGDVGDVAIGVARVEDVQARPGDGLGSGRFRLGHDHRMPWATGRQPLATLVR